MSSRQDYTYNPISNQLSINCTGLPTERFRVQTPAKVELWFEISAPPVPPSQLSYDEYNDRTLSVGR